MKNILKGLLKFTNDYMNNEVKKQIIEIVKNNDNVKFTFNNHNILIKNKKMYRVEKTLNFTNLFSKKEEIDINVLPETTLAKMYKELQKAV